MVDGHAFEAGREPTVQYAGVAGRWPETFDVRLVAGRTFTEHELSSDAAVALVNARLATTFWPGEDPIGRRFKLADEPSNPWLTVIGVVPDIRTVKLDESRATPPTAYLPHRLISTRNYGIVVRTRAAPESVIAGVRAAVHAVDPSLALFDVYSMEQVRWLSYWMYVLWGTLFAVFGAIALVIAAIGVYGVVFYTVSQRTREIGLRIALGARRAQVVGPILRQVALLCLGGIAIGLAGSLAATPVIGSLLIGVSPTDPDGTGDGARPSSSSSHCWRRGCRRGVRRPSIPRSRSATSESRRCHSPLPYKIFTAPTPQRLALAAYLSRDARVNRVATIVLRST